MSHLFSIGSKKIGEGQPCFIIAEAGVNHNGRLDYAKCLIDFAVDAGVDAVKFQTFITEDVIVEGIEKAAYQRLTTDSGESQTAMLRRLEINEDFHKELVEYCRQKKIIFLSTCSEEKSLDLLESLGVPVFKLASMDAVNPMFLEKVARKGKPVILSTGMCSEVEIERAYTCLRDNGCREIALLKCTSNYPTPPDKVNLNAMRVMQAHFDAVIGFSDHSQGIGASPYAVAMGARIIEKHFTLDKSLDGPDHQASLSPEELAQFVREIRKVELMLGHGNIVPADSEMETRLALRRSLVFSEALKKGGTLSRKHINAKRTGGKGLASSEFYNVLGCKLLCDVRKDQPLEWGYFSRVSRSAAV